MRWILAIATGLLLAACGRNDAGSTPLPTKEGTIGRVQQGLEKADQDAAKRRAEIDQVGEPDEGKKALSTGY